MSAAHKLHGVEEGEQQQQDQRSSSSMLKNRQELP